MSKYIIELNDKCARGIVVFGKTDEGVISTTQYVENLEVLNSDYINEHFGDLQDTAYQRGLDDAWEAARKLFSSMADSDIEKGFPIEWNNGGFNALMNLQPQEAIEKLKAYEEKQKHDDKIEVGDEVEWDNDFTGDRFIVTRIYQPYGKKEQCDGIDDDGDVYRAVLIESLVKTGRHFDIASILEDMRND